MRPAMDHNPPVHARAADLILRPGATLGQLVVLGGTQSLKSIPWLDLLMLGV